MERDKDKFSFKVSFSMYELYRDNLVDLLHKKGKRKKLMIKQDSRGSVVVEGGKIVEVHSAQELQATMDGGMNTRHVAATNMNAESSRSHLCQIIFITSTNLSNNVSRTGKLTLVDLAGSERAGKTGASGDTMKEAQSINKSLSALGNVISALTTGSKHVPYRDSQLTQLMKDSLGGNAKTLMFVNCSPSVYNEMETKNSLEYAKRVKEIKNNPTLNLETKAMQMAQRQIEAQRIVIDSLKGLAQDNGLADKLAEVLAQYEKNDEQHEGGSVFSLNLDAIKELKESDDNQIKEKPHSGRDSIAPRKSVLQQDSSRSNESSGRLSMRPSLSGPIKQFKK